MEHNSRQRHMIQALQVAQHMERPAKILCVQKGPFLQQAVNNAILLRQSQDL